MSICRFACVYPILTAALRFSSRERPGQKITKKGDPKDSGAIPFRSSKVPLKGLLSTETFYSSPPFVLFFFSEQRQDLMTFSV